MISKERVRNMTKLAVYDAGEGKRTEKMTRYFRRDYVAMEMIKSFFGGTIAYGLLLFLWVVYEMETLENFFKELDVTEFAVVAVLVYVLFIVLFLLITYIVYNKRYTAGRKQLKQYYRGLRKVHALLDQEGIPRRTEKREE